MCTSSVCDGHVRYKEAGRRRERERKKEPPQIRVFFLPKKVGGPSFLGFFSLGQQTAEKEYGGPARERERETEFHFCFQLLPLPN